MRDSVPFDANTLEGMREYIEAMSIPIPECGCLVWLGGLTDFGYGRVMFQGKSWRVHRLMYKIFHGTIRRDLVLDHKCRVRSCCNPLHVEPVTIGENVLRGVGSAAARKRQTHCKNGHEFTERNTRVNEHGWRTCRRCDADKHALKRAA